MLEIYEVMFEVYLGDESVHRQIMKAPKEILIANFLQTAEQIRSDQRPIKFKMIRQEVIWDEFEQKQRVLNYEVEIDNNARTAWEEKRKENDND